jgi:hypothetical protein
MQRAGKILISFPNFGNEGICKIKAIFHASLQTRRQQKLHDSRNTSTQLLARERMNKNNINNGMPGRWLNWPKRLPSSRKKFLPKQLI